MKKVLALLVSVLLLLAMIPMGAVSVSAASSSEEIKSQLDILIGKYPAGSQHSYQSCWYFVQMLSKSIFGNSIPPQASNHYQLKDIASYNYQQIGNTLTCSSGNLSESTLKSLFLSSQSGDVIQMDYTKKSGVDSLHVMMVYSVSSTGVVFYHAGSPKDSDGDGIKETKGKVWFGASNGSDPLYGTTGKELTWSQLKSYLYKSDDGLSVYRSTKSVGNGTPNYASTNPDDYSFPTRSLYYTNPTMTGSDVAWVQAVLKKLGFSITIDGKYGPTTRDVIKQFQTKYGLEVDGKCGPVTRTKLQSLWNSMKCIHTYTNACDTTCNKCGAVRTVGGHSYSNACDASCNICGAARTPAAHLYSNACDATCNVCGAVRTVGSHSYGSKITAAATCGKDGVKTYTCSICGDNYTESIPATGKHTYDDDYDATCNVCGEEREVPEKPPVTPDLPADAPAFVVESTDAREGEEFTVAIRTQRNSGIVSMKLSVAYDADVLELIALEEQDFANVVFSPLTKNPFMVNWADAISPNNTTDGVVVLATFRVKEGAPLGKTEITLTYDPEDVYDENYDNVAFRVENGFVEIVDYIPGDVNADGRVNNKDLGLLQQYLSGWDVRVDEKAGDVNADGRVNNKDLGLFQQYLSGWDVELG